MSMAKPTEALYETYRTALRGISLPLAWVDLDRFRENARRLVARSNGRPIRLATKSIRCRPLLRLVLDEHPGFRGLMAYSPREAAWLGREGFDDVLEVWKERSHTLGQWIRVTDPASVIEGVAVGLDTDGGLLIRQDSGVVVKKMAGDVVQLR